MGFGQRLRALQAPCSSPGGWLEQIWQLCPLWEHSQGFSLPGGLLGADCGSCRLDQDPQQAEATSAPAPASAGKCSRTFISFSDDETFERFFPKAKPPRLPVREICPVTHKPAVYRDPITDIPYSNIRAFKIIREAYKKYITAHGLPSAAASAALGATAPPGPDPNVRPTRQKIIIKQSVPTT